MRLLIVAVALLVRLALPSCAVPTKPDTKLQTMPDVLVWIDARNPHSAFVGIIYPKLVSRTEAETAVAALLRETGWVAQNINVSDGSATNPGEKPMTAVDFNTTAGLELASGYLPIEPIIKAFRNTNLMEIQYVLPQQFFFRGLGDYKNKYVQIKLVAGSNAYRYSIRVTDASFTNLNLPGPSTSSAQTPASPNSGYTVKVLIVLLAIITAVIVFMIARRATSAREK